MRNWHWVSFAALFGLLVGRYIPADSVRSVPKQPQPKREEVRKPQTLGGFEQLAQIPDRAVRPQTSPKPAAPAVPGATNAPAVQPARKHSPEDLQARIEEAKELWKVRVDIARAQMIDKLGLSADGTAAFDTAVNTMNQDIFNAMQAFAEEVERGSELTPEYQTRVFAGILATVSEAYDGLALAVPADKRDDVSRMQMADFIDPAVVEPLIRVQGQLEKAKVRPVFPGMR